MVSKLPTRLARLTLYSGSNCSLCDVAKAELTKIRQTRNFELDIVNIHDPGQEHWRKKYVYWIPALHIDGKEVAKGRWDGQTVTQALNAWQKTLECTPEDKGESSLDESVSRCFNCGSTQHIVSSCPAPHNTELIALSRQMYNFFKQSRVIEPMTLSAAAEFKHQRYGWIDSFEPGRILDPLLREALGLHDDGVCSNLPWLKNMAVWGYPSGWFSEQDPREKVLQRIDNLFVETLDSGEFDNTLSIFGDDTVEILDINASPGCKPFHRQDIEEVHEEQVEPGCCRRWATYPPTHFSSDLLPVYNGTRLPPIQPVTSSTFTSERHLLWERLLHDADSTQPQRLVSQDIGKVLQPNSLSPPLPIAPPPPLPPLPPCHLPLHQPPIRK
ncbi:hypothetical protein BGY98DRAFT_1088217 [Russula aff. rugulosa BPL654]|nr:hypothetical protein BGY98DRAFT_1088217 [Russula aff. rugulosa BPL654]